MNSSGAPAGARGRRWRRLQHRPMMRRRKWHFTWQANWLLLYITSLGVVVESTLSVASVSQRCCNRNSAHASPDSSKRCMLRDRPRASSLHANSSVLLGCIATSRHQTIHLQRVMVRAPHTSCSHEGPSLLASQTTAPVYRHPFSCRCRHARLPLTLTDVRNRHSVLAGGNCKWMRSVHVKTPLLRMGAQVLPFDQYITDCAGVSAALETRSALTVSSCFQDARGDH